MSSIQPAIVVPFNSKTLGYQGLHNGDGARMTAQQQSSKREVTQSIDAAQAKAQATVQDLDRINERLRTEKNRIVEASKATQQTRIDTYA